MSGAAMTAANMLPVKLPVDRLIALEMAKVVPDGAVQPRYWGFRETLAQAAGVSVRTVQRSLDRLQALGAIIHQGIDGGRRAVRYLLAFALPNWPATSAKMATCGCPGTAPRAGACRCLGTRTGACRCPGTAPRAGARCRAAGGPERLAAG
jgi:hypothetical protein